MSKHNLPMLVLFILLAVLLPTESYPMAAQSASLNMQSVLGPNIVANGNFETPDVTSITFDTYYAGQSVGGWTVESGSIDHISERYWQAADGRQSVDLSGHSNLPGTISQMLLTSPLQTYLLRFALAGNPETTPCPNPERFKQMEVWWGTRLLDTLTFDTDGHSNWSMGWSFHQYTITATNALSQLRFKSLTLSCYGPVLDMVSVQSYNGVIPLLDLPLDYSGMKFSDVALGNNVGGWVNSWFDHDTPDYNKDQELELWNGKELSDTLTITCTYGLNCYDGHNGIDYQRQSDDTIYAAAPGTVVDLCDSENYPCSHPQGVITSDRSYGKWVLIRHGQKYATFYAHLDRVNPNLTIGTEITDTKTITVGIMGGTGGWPIHLHFGVYYDANGNGKWEDTYQGFTEAVDPYGWYGIGSDPWWNTSLYLWKFPLWDSKTGNEYGAILTTPSGKGKLTILPGVLSSPITLELWDAPMPTSPSINLRAIGHPVWLKVLEWLNEGTGGHSANSASISTFPQPVSINIRYGVGETQHLVTNQIAIFRLNESSSSWVALPTTLDYNLKEATAQTTEMGIFSLQAPLLCPADSQEPDDNYDVAGAVLVDGTPVSRLFDIDEDEDWFRFEAMTGADYIIRTENLTTGVDTVLELYALDGLTLLASDDNSGGGTASKLKWRAPLDGTYFLRVAQASNSAYGCDATYELSVSQLPPTISKTAIPEGGVHFGDALTYTLVISAAPGTQLRLYDPLEDMTFVDFAERPPGVTHVDTTNGTIYLGGIISGTLEVTPTNQITVSFVTRVGVPGTAGWTDHVTNRACVFPLGGTLGTCTWSNEVTNPAYRPYEIFLPLVMRNH